MSKFFMYGTDLQNLEQTMMLVPNFISRGSGLIVVKNSQHEGCNVNCFKCENYINSQSCEKTCDCFYERLDAVVIPYGNTVKDYYKNFKSYNLKKRLKSLIKSFDGEIFLNPIHRSRFHTVCRIFCLL